MLLATYDWWLNLLFTWNQFFFSLLQTIAVLVTGGFAIRYTLETIKLRRHAEMQADAAQNQLEDSRQERIRGSYPFFTFEYPAPSRYLPGQEQTWNIRVTNRAAAVYALYVVPSSSEVGVEISPRNYLPTGGEFTIRFRTRNGPFPEQWRFYIEYYTLLNSAHRQNYGVDRGQLWSAEIFERETARSRPDAAQPASIG